MKILTAKRLAAITANPPRDKDLYFDDIDDFSFINDNNIRPINPCRVTKYRSSVIENGVDEALDIAIINGTVVLVDGHHRKFICVEHEKKSGSKPRCPIRVLTISTMEEVRHRQARSAMTAKSTFVDNAFAYRAYRDQGLSWLEIADMPDIRKDRTEVARDIKIADLPQSIVHYIQQNFARLAKGRIRALASAFPKWQNDAVPAEELEKKAISYLTQKKTKKSSSTLRIVKKEIVLPVAIRDSKDLQVALAKALKDGHKSIKFQNQQIPIRFIDSA